MLYSWRYLFLTISKLVYDCLVLSHNKVISYYKAILPSGKKGVLRDKWVSGINHLSFQFGHHTIIDVGYIKTNFAKGIM